MTSPWMVYAWEPLLWQASNLARLHLMHLGTRITDFGGDGSHRCGQTLWGNPREQPRLGIAWDWLEIQKGVVAMSDPLGLVTNIKLLEDSGEPLTTFKATLQLHNLIHALPWQHEVQLALSANSG